MDTMRVTSYISETINALLRPEPNGHINPSLSNITVVGGLFDKHYNLLGDDIATIKRSLIVLERAGITIADHPTFHFYNLLAPLKNDFLEAAFDCEATPPKTDALILCGLCNTRNRDSVIGAMRREQRDIPYEDFSAMYRDLDKGFRDNREISISYHQLDEMGWPLGAHKANAKIVVTRGDYDEINSDHFLFGDFYRAAMPTSDNFETVYGMIPGPLGILVHNDAVAELKQTANSEDKLGSRILAL